MPFKRKLKKKFPTAVIGKKSTAKLTGGRSSRRKNSVSSKPGKSDELRKSAALAGVAGQPAKMSPVKATKKAVDVKKASSFDKAKKKNKPNVSPMGRKKRATRKPRVSRKK